MNKFKVDFRYKFHYLIPIFILAFPFSSYATDAKPSNNKKLLILTEQLYPLNYTASGKDDELVLGYATRLVRAVMEESGLPYEIILVPWARLVRTINQKNDVMAFSMSRTKTRDPLYHWIGEIIPVRLFLYGKRSDLKRLPRSLEEAKKFRIGTRNATVPNEYLKAKGFPNLVEVKDNNRYMLLLERDRFDLFPFIEYAIGPAAIRGNFDVNYFASAVAIPELSTTLWIAMNKNSDPILVRKLRNAYETTVATGSYQEIIRPLIEMIESIDSQALPNN